MSTLAVYRSIYTEEQFQKIYGTANDLERPPLRLRERLAKNWKCSSHAFRTILKKRIPILGWLPRYRFKKWILGDLIAGLTVGIVHIPQGTFAVLSLMTGSVIDEHLFLNTLERNLTSDEQFEIHSQRIGMAAAIAFLMGLIMVVMFVLQLGFLATYLSEPIVKAFTNAAAFHVTISQIQNMMGLPLPRHTGSFTIFKTLASVFKALHLMNVAELVISILCLIVLIPIKELNARFRTKLRTPIPGEIIMVLVATGITFASSLDVRYNVQIVGSIPAGFPSPKLPTLKVIPDVIGDTIAITFVGYAVSVSLAMIYAEKHRYTIDPNQELLAHGISNMVSSLFNCFPSSATLATTNILESAGGHTQLSGFFTSCVVLVVLLWVGPLFNHLPKAVLACINVVSLRQMFLQFQDLPELWKISKTDFSVWVVTWLAVIILNVEVGLAIGVVFSMMTVVCRTQRAQCSVLGRAVNTEIYRPVEQNDKCFEIPGLKILSYNSPIYYGNRDIFKEAVSKIVGLTQEKIRKREKALRALENGRKISITVVDTGIANPVYNPVEGSTVIPEADAEIKSLIIDCSGIIFIDIAGARLFIQMCIECQKAGMHLLLSGCNEKVLRTLVSSGIMDHLSEQQVFVTVHDAACYAEENMDTFAEKSSMVWV
uniref:STAS domain-containing protein n=1 Tax=Leptobrachium leishanense TaxID=445787 RepID=A0A8C5LKD2_9ANUR